MKKIVFVSILSLLSCVKNSPAHPPVGGVLSKEDLNVSKNRAKNLNLLERKQIQDWINQQDKKFYSTGLNYWTDISDSEFRTKKKEGELVSYEYDLYDFEGFNEYAYYDKHDMQKVIADHFKDGILYNTVNTWLGDNLPKTLNYR